MNLHLASRAASVLVTGLLVAATLVATSGPSSADSGEPANDRTISGTVTNTEGVPLADVRVTPFLCSQYACGGSGGVVTDQTRG
ncbi:hypothetical protein [Aeromicrobium fastidiosum]|uniref:Carboxypeptidase regulatory-like domain-containing protein n=1 Tax=Aeromicrobium fastidiosum TaxID=52699 RepID=A0A641AQT5_9ACTN|nr:hypothetical protein [Aeromicrobium fastidiosum]KAA1380460.1 hypothetical protein ESP62_004580 [Aeromicrobium fastidiosum]MBP2390041.1 hypothetical protein [Aeromicrobium fastidiosum]